MPAVASDVAAKVTFDARDIVLISFSLSLSFSF
jgi:hypothetical protein